MKKIFSTLSLLILLVILGLQSTSCACLTMQESTQDKAKYVFYFIGDGMGLAQVALSEDYLAYTQGKGIATTEMSFTQFPELGLITTFSASNIITCSSAAGTALSTGSKTKNGMLGLAPDSVTVLTSIAQKIKNAGYKVGITSTVCLNHATPAAFYAHNISRNDYYNIALQLPQSGYDFFGGGGFLSETGLKRDQPSVVPLLEQGGYTFIFGKDEFNALSVKPKKAILLQAKDKNFLREVPYALDRKPDDISQADIVQVAISCLENEKGFFLMSEAGKIDFACHSNDAKAAILETMDLSQAVEVALEFARNHPHETLIVVTADHETGGLTLGDTSQYVMNFNELDSQTSSIDLLNNSQLRDQAKEVAAMNTRAKIGWTTSGHTGCPVPVYAYGAGSHLFGGRMDNTDVPKKICQAMGIAF